MSEIRFTPSVWQSAGKAYEQAGAELVSGVVDHLSVLDVSQICLLYTSDAADE